MTDDELEFSLDVLRELSVKAFNSGNRSDARRLRFILNALLKERAARFDQRGENGFHIGTAKPNAAADELAICASSKF